MFIIMFADNDVQVRTGIFSSVKQQNMKIECTFEIFDWDMKIWIDTRNIGMIQLMRSHFNKK